MTEQKTLFKRPPGLPDGNKPLPAGHDYSDSFIRALLTLPLEKLGCCLMARVKKVRHKIKDAAAAKKLLRSPDLMDVLVKEVQRSISGAKDTILTLILFMSGRLVKSSRAASTNVIVHSKTGEGKDAIARAVGKLLPPDLFISRSSLSPTAMKHWLEGHKDWDWGKKALYVEDISAHTLNSDEFKILAGTEEETSTVTDRQQRARDIKRGGKPPIILTMADMYLKDQMVRRYAICHIDEREGRSILLKMGKEREQGGVHHVSQQGRLIQQAMSKLKRVDVTIPYYKNIAAVFPEDRTYRTLFGRFLDLIAASAALHQNQRRKTIRGKVIANKDDYNYAVEVVYKILEGDEYGYSDTQQEILQILSGNHSRHKAHGRPAWTVNQIATACDMHERSMRDVLAQLKKRGTIKSTKVKVITNGLRHRIKVYQRSKQEDLVLPNWSVISKSISKDKRHK